MPCEGTGVVETRNPAQVRRAIELERERLAGAVGDLRTELADVRTKRLRVAKGALAGTIALLAVARLRRRR
jgi:hypothetical protein